MTGTNYRIDKVKQDITKVPCGMGTIVYLGAVPPSAIFIRNKLPDLAADETFLFSRWSSEKQDYIIYDTRKFCTPTIDSILNSRI